MLPRTLTGLLAATLVGLAVIVTALPAMAARTVTISGGGWGHGIGMSQYGSYGRAQNGKSAKQILEHYYSGAGVSTARMPRTIRVGLVQERSSLSATSERFAPDGGKVVFKVAGASQRLARGGEGSRWKVVASSTGGMRLYKNGNLIKRDGKSVFGDPAHPLVLLYERFGTAVDVGEKPYDYVYGRLLFGTYKTTSCSAGNCLRLVAKLSMQKYLYGLGEVPSSWPAAALRAQAIAGRTYAYEKVLRSGQHRYPCDCAVFDSTYDQAYIGDYKRTSSGRYWDEWKAAVDDTKSEVVLYGGAPIQALYSSSSGGHTEHNENVWGGTGLPYLRGVPDAADDVAANPNHKWKVEMSFSAFESKLNAAYGTGDLVSFDLIRPFGVSGRVTVVKADNTGGARIVGSKKKVRVSGWSLRAALGLKDTLFRVAIAQSGGDGGAAASAESDALHSRHGVGSTAP